MSNEKLDGAGVLQKFGVSPERIVDYLSLIGDSVDNVPGVEKVGPKTATKWLQQYGSLDALLDHASEISGVVGENLRKAREWLPQARRLLTIQCDVELPVSIEALKPLAPDQEALLGLFTRYEFKTWLKELKELKEPVQETDAVTNTPNKTHTTHYETILLSEQLEKWLNHIDQATLVALDTETTDLDPLQAKLVGISWSIAPLQAAYLPLGHLGHLGHQESDQTNSTQLDLQKTLERLKPWLENPHKKKCGQNIKYDKHIFANYGITLEGIEHDTLLQSYVLESHKSHNMTSLAQRHLSLETISYEDVTGKGVNQIRFDQVSIDQATCYAAEDADVTLQLHQVLYPQIERDEKLNRVYGEIEMPVMQVLWRMERNGVLIDSEQLKQHSEELGKKMLDLQTQAFAAAGGEFNLNSPKQIAEIFFEKLKLPIVKKTPTGAPSTDEEVLEKLALDYPLPKFLLDFRTLAKLKSTYTDKLPRMVNPTTGRVHTNYAQAVAVTGRLASNEPNLQNIPVRHAQGKRIRAAFIAPPGSQIVSADYSQIELRIMAHLSQDPGLLNAFAQGEDIHQATAAEIFGVGLSQVSQEQRRYAKTINFGLIYGMSAFGLARQLGIAREAAQNYIDRYFARYPDVARYMKVTREKAKKQGFVETVFGRKLWLPEINSGNALKRQGAERAAINAPMQGTAADIIKLAMIQVQTWLDKNKLQSKLILQVHDELVIEATQQELIEIKERLPTLMTQIVKLDVPLLVETGVGKSWGEAH